MEENKIRLSNIEKKKNKILALEREIKKVKSYVKAQIIHIRGLQGSLKQVRSEINKYDTNTKSQMEFTEKEKI